MSADPGRRVFAVRIRFKGAGMNWTHSKPLTYQQAVKLATACAHDPRLESEVVESPMAKATRVIWERMQIRKAS